jgi:two-component system phosphate regulon sensor histidine kinase PhoR
MYFKNTEILVVDDELLIRDLLYDFFSTQGYVVHLAENGKQAQELIDRVDIQVILLDLKMPVMDGIELASIIARKKPQIPVIIMTAYPSMDSAIECIRKGVYNYIVKPFKMAELYQIVKDATHERTVRTRSNCSKAMSEKELTE